MSKAAYTGSYHLSNIIVKVELYHHIYCIQWYIDGLGDSLSVSHKYTTDFEHPSDKVVKMEAYLQKCPGSNN